MSLFDRKNKEENTPAACCSCGKPAPETAETAGTPCCRGTAENACCQKAATGVCCVKVLGSGCKNCHDLLKNTQEAVATLGLDVEVEYVTDLQGIAKYGVTSMPALVVNERVASMGRVLKAAEVQRLLESR